MWEAKQRARAGEAASGGQRWDGRTHRWTHGHAQSPSNERWETRGTEGWGEWMEEVRGTRGTGTGGSEMGGTREGEKQML